jgi:cytoskeletal protein RodZ
LLFLVISMEEIGRQLQETRERLGLTLEEIERTTRIRKVRLEALERGELDSMPSQAQARGFLRNYAEALGLNAQELLDRYDEARGRKASPPRPADDRSATQTGTGRRSASELILTTLVALTVIAVLVWGSGQLIEVLSREPATPTEEVALAPLVEDATPTPPAATATNPASGESAVEPTAIVPTATLIAAVVVDGEQVYRGRLQAGEQLNYTGDTAIEVTTGNAGGLRIFFNDRDEGLMGEIGQVVVRIWTPRGAQTPTPTVTVTPTASPFLTATPTPTQTILPTQVP